MSDNVVNLLDIQLVSDNVVNHFRLQKEPKKCKCLSVCLAHYTLLGWNYLHMLDYSKFTLLKLNLIKFIYEILLKELAHLEKCPGPASGILTGSLLDKGNWGRKKNPIGDILSSSEDGQIPTESYLVPRHDLYSLQASV